MTTKQGRIHFMDPLRGILMMLGVLLHAAQVFNPDFKWLIQSTETTPLAPYFVGLIHLFRMPAFYIVSGFFTLLTVRKVEANRFLKLRAQKILIPFIVTALTLNSIQCALLHSELNPSATPFVFSQYLIDGEWVSHLWFLAYLFCFILIVYFWKKLFSTGKHPSISKWLEGLTKLPVAVWLFSLPAYYLALVILGKTAPQIFLFRYGFSIYDFLYYFQFFAFGLLMSASRPLFEKFTRLSIPQSLLFVGAWYVLANFTALPQETLAKILEAYARLLIIWISCQIVFSLFKKLADRPSNWATFASSASYTVYLFHHCLVVLFGLILIRAGIGGILGFLILTSVVLVLSAFIHVKFVAKNDWAAFLFGSPTKAPRDQ